MADAAEVAVPADRQAYACGAPPAQQSCHVSWSAIKYEPPSHRISVHARPPRTGPCAPQPPIAAAMGAGGNGWRVRPVTGWLASARTIAAAAGA